LQAILDDVLKRIGNDLMGGISSAVVDTVDSLFGEKMHPVDNDNREGLFSIDVLADAAEQAGPDVICLGFSTYKNRLSVRKILHVGVS
jgi:glycine/serine hydroxymethyltransferase